MTEFMPAVGAVVIAAPLLLLALVALCLIADRPLSETATARSVHAATSIGFAATITMLAMMLVTGERHAQTGFHDWVKIGQPGDGAHYQFAIKFVFDRLSIPFTALIFMLCGVIGAFANRYLHREPGYHRFFSYYALFLLGMVCAALAGTIETLFLGWELVGLSSVLLIGFFQERTGPVANAQRVWCVYRISDAALLLAAVMLHHSTGEGDWDQITGYHEAAEATAWPHGTCLISSTQALIVGLLLIAAAAGKSALIPFSGWLPRAMEGPTPSSAIFYGALSVHLGAYLLLRAGPLLDAAPLPALIVVVLGLGTAALATISARVQTDIKSALAFASLAQVGLIVAEIGFGWRYLPLAHLLGHASLRTLQFLRAPSVLQDHFSVVNALGEHPWRPTARRRVLYRFALERGYLDAMLDCFIVQPFTRLARFCERCEREVERRVTASTDLAKDEDPKILARKTA